MNLSTYPIDATATTREDCARQRMEHLAVLSVRTSLELCVGPSLRTLARLGAQYGIVVTGNVIDPRYRAAYPAGRWVIGDALALDYAPYSAVVFAPPLSRGCSGKREDALMIDEVVPRYGDFLATARDAKVRVVVLVLPARSMATSGDRAQLHRLVARTMADGWTPNVVPLTSGPRRITKYVDVYLERR
jgi:hypothetical protein